MLNYPLERASFIVELLKMLWFNCTVTRLKSKLLKLFWLLN